MKGKIIMPKVNQIYSLLNDINSQMFGEDAIDVHDLSGIISMGQTVMSTTDNTDLFFSKLIDRIGKTVIRTLDLELEFPTLFRDEYNYGCILQKINIQPFTAINTSEWDIGGSGFTPTFADIKKANISITYFDGLDTWKYQTSIPIDQMLATAFTNESTMSAFITGITSAMSDSMTIALNDMSRTAINNFMAEKIKSGSNVINLLTLYNDFVGAGNTLTVDQAIHNKEFYRFATTVISEYVDYLREPSVLYNVDGLVRATARDNMHVLMLNKFAKGINAYLLSDSFKDLFSMPLYKTINYWQGNKGASATNDFATNSSIKVTPSSEADKESPTDVEQSGIVCLLADRQAIAVGLNKRRSSVFYNDIDGYENIASSASLQYINDMSENSVLFIIDSASSEGGEGTEGTETTTTTRKVSTK